MIPHFSNKFNDFDHCECYTISEKCLRTKQLRKHVLTKEVAYNSVLIERRKALHVQTAQAIEQLFHDQLEEYHSVLAHHYSNGGHTEKAMIYLLKDFRTAWLTSLDQSFLTE